MAFSIPVMAATLAFVTYTSTSHDFDVAVIFSSFSLFQLLRQPLMFLPRALSAISDAHSALTRLEKVFHAEIRREDETLNVDLGLHEAVRVEDATFEWEESLAVDVVDGGKEKKGEKTGKEHGKKVVDEEKKGDTVAPFRVRDVRLVIPRGELVAIVGPVGSGKVCTRINRLESRSDGGSSVESFTRSHRRNEESAREGNLWWEHWLLPSNSVDSELYFGVYSGIGNGIMPWLIPHSETMSFSDKRLTRVATGRSSRNPLFFRTCKPSLTVT